MKNKIQDLLYYGAGLAIIAKEKIEHLLDDIIESDPEIRKVGEEGVKGIITRSDEAKKSFEKWLDEVTSEISEKSGATKEVVSDFIAETLAKPIHKKHDLEAKIKETSLHISEKASITYEEAKERVEGLVADLHDFKSEVTNKLENSALDLEKKAKNIKDSGENFWDEFKTRCESGETEVKSSLSRLGSKLRKRLHIADASEKESMENHY